MKKIRVLHISPDSIIYGTERHILSILKYSEPENFEHYVATPVKGALNDELDHLGVKNFIAGRKPGYKSKFKNIFSKDAIKLFKIIRREKFDIVHTHLNIFAGIIGRLAGAPIIIHTRHGVFWSEEDLQKISFLSRLFQKMKSFFFDATIAIGDYEKKTLVQKLGYDEKKIRTTINGVNLIEINNKVNKKLTKKNLFNTDDLIVGAVGRLERQKGFSFFLEAVDSLKDQIQGITFVIIGNGSYKDELIKKRNSMNLEEKIIFLDYKNNILDYVYNFDIMVMTSLWEGLSYAVQEAMALSKPVIALTSPNVSGVKELVSHGVSGYLIEDNYVENLGKYIKILSKDLNKRLLMGRAANEREKNHFPEWRTAADMDNVYRELFSKIKSNKA